MRMIAFLALLLALAATVLAAPPLPPAKKLDLQPVPTFAAAAELALADLTAEKDGQPLIAPEDRPFQWYIWADDGDPTETIKLISLAVSLISRDPSMHRPHEVTDGRQLRLARIDLRHHAPRAEDLAQFLALREEFQFEPAQSRLITQDTLQLLAVDDRPKVKRATRPKQRVEKKDKKTGKTTTVVIEGPEIEEEVLLADAGDTQVIRQAPGSVPPAILAALTEHTRSQAPVVSASYFVTRALSALQEDGLFATLYGGRYYEFIGIQPNTTGHGTDQDLWLQDHVGLGNLKAGLTADQIFERLRSDQRAALFHSRVTAKFRRIVYFRGPQGRGTQGTVSITDDPRKKDIDIRNNPLMNLLEVRSAAREALWDGPNGLMRSVLFNGQGKLQRVAPIEVVSNREVPAPYEPILEGGIISCLSCHWIRSPGWQPFNNDVKRIVPPGFFQNREGQPRLDILGDTTDPDRTLYDLNSRAAGLYAGDPSKFFARANDDLAEAVLRATGPWKEAADEAQANIAKVAGQKLWDLYVRRNYTPVSPTTALRDLGFEVRGGEDAAADAARALTELLPPEPRALIRNTIPEDPRIAALKAGVSISRPEWDLVRDFAATRALRTLAAQAENKELEKP